MSIYANVNIWLMVGGNRGTDIEIMCSHISHALANSFISDNTKRYKSINSNAHNIHNGQVNGQVKIKFENTMRAMF